MFAASMAPTTDLDIVNVTKRFGSHAAVNNVTFSVAPGRIFDSRPVGLRQDHAHAHDRRLRGTDLGRHPYPRHIDDRRSANRRPVNMVFQSLALFPMMSVGENVAYGLTCRRVSRAEAEERASRMLERVGLKGFGERRVTALSGGQRQRVAIARCLVLEPTLVLLDEPLGALDLKLREHMKIELKQLQATFNTTFAYITHDQSEALVMSDRIAVMNQGRFEQVGSPRELYHNPATPFVASFVGETNRWQGEVVSAAGGIVSPAPFIGCNAPGRGGAPVESRDRLRPAGGDRPLAGSGVLGGLPNCFEGRVSAVLFDGANSSLLIETPGFDGPVRAVLPQAGPLAGSRSAPRFISAGRPTP